MNGLSQSTSEKSLKLKLRLPGGYRMPLLRVNVSVEELFSVPKKRLN